MSILQCGNFIKVPVHSRDKFALHSCSLLGGSLIFVERFLSQKKKNYSQLKLTPEKMRERESGTFD